MRFFIGLLYSFEYEIKYVTFNISSLKTFDVTSSFMFKFSGDELCRLSNDGVLPELSC